MVRIALTAVLALAASVMAAGDPAGDKNVGNGAGKQFITGGCLSNADCASACCAQQNGGGGVCSGVGAQFQAGKTGCGFNDPNGKKAAQPQQPSTPPKQQQPQKGSKSKSGVVSGDPAGFNNVGNGAGKQFITGACVSNADCASNCCAQQNGGNGVCSGVGAQFQAGKTGCGFNDPDAQQTIATAKKQAGGQPGGQSPPEQQQQQQQKQPEQQQKQPEQGDNNAVVGGDPAGFKNVGNGAGTQFITGACVSNADCASQCCAQQNGKGGVCSGVGAQFQAGKTGCGFNDPNAQQTIATAKKQAGGQPGGQSPPQQEQQQQQPQQKQPEQGSKSGKLNGDPAGFSNVGNGAGKQFITGACVSNADCASQCCAQQNGGNGVCSGIGAQFQAGKTGCGFNDPNAQQTIAQAKKQADGQGFKMLKGRVAKVFRV